ncbi:MAG: ATP-binding protein, partial [Thermoplasmata archaeon]
MMGRRPKGLYSISELILLHLARFPFLEDNFSIPDELSQEGIALGVGIQRSHVPRYISKLILSGDIEERKGRLIISGRRKKVYVLTEKGIAEVKKLLERYYQYQKINSHTLADGEAAILKKLQEMPSHQIPFPYTRSEVNNCGNEGQALYVDYRPNTLNINNPHETIEVSSDVSSSSSLFCFSDYFAGRKEEINILTNGVSSQHSILYIYGPPGIGKTALISYFCKNYLKDREKFIYNIPSGLSIAPWDNNTESSSLKSFLLHFNRYLNTGGRFSLPVSLLNNTELNIHDAAEIISGILKTCGMVLVIDDFNNINSPCDTFFHFITILAREEYNVAPGKIILIGRNKGTFYDARDVVQKRVLPVELRGLSMPEMEK